MLLALSYASCRQPAGQPGQPELHSVHKQPQGAALLAAGTDDLVCIYRAAAEKVDTINRSENLIRSHPLLPILHGGRQRVS